MRKPFIAIACALSLGLSGCGAARTVAETVGISESKIAEVQRLTESICSFVVAADSVSALLGKTAYTAISLAQGICSVVSSSNRSLRRGVGPAPALNGVPIIGYFK